MNYIDEVTQVLSRQLEAAALPCEPGLLRYYTLLLLAKGRHAIAEDVHDAWAIWQSSTAPHKDLVPFTNLTAEAQALDEPFAAAIHRADEELAASVW